MTKASIALAFLALASAAGAQQGPVTGVAAGKAKQVAPAAPGGAVSFERLERGVFSFSAQLEQALFNPQGGRAPLNRGVSSLNRPLKPTDGVYVLVPSRYIVSPTDAVLGNTAIEYLWEVVITDQGILVAVPVPVLGSFGRAANACSCGDKREGRCTTTNFCLGPLPLEKNCMKKIDMDTVPDIDLLKNICLKPGKGSQDVQPDANFLLSYAIGHRGGQGTIVVWGTAAARPVKRTAWAGALIEGAGYFLDDTGEAAAVPGATAAAAAFVSQVITEQGPSSRSRFGIKERGIK